MIPKLEFGHLYKFVASLGIALMAVAVVGPWAILRDQGALMVSEAELAELTPRAQRVLELKQAHAELVMEWYPRVAAVVFLVGAALTVCGLLFWLPRQAVANKIEEAGLPKVKLEKLSSEETERKLETEVAEATLGTEAGGVEPSRPEVPRGGEPPAPRAEAEPGGPTADDALTIREYVRARYEEAEALAASALEAAFGAERAVHTDVKIMSDSGHEIGRADIVALPFANSSDSSLVFDLKLITPKSAARQTRTALLDAAQSAGALHPHSAAAVAILIAKDDEEKRRVLPIVRGASERLQRILQTPSAAVVTTMSELESMPPAELAARILGAIRAPQPPAA